MTTGMMMGQVSMAPATIKRAPTAHMMPAHAPSKANDYRPGLSCSSTSCAKMIGSPTTPNDDYRGPPQNNGDCCNVGSDYYGPINDCKAPYDPYNDGPSPLPQRWAVAKTKRQVTNEEQ